MPTLSGVVRDSGGNPIQRIVRVYRRESGLYVGSSLSDPSTGAWSVTTADTELHFAIAYDTATGASDWDATRFALHFNGTNGSTVFSDEKGIEWVASGATITTSDSKFGGASGDFSSDTKYITALDSSRFRPGTADFFIDTWVKPSKANNDCFFVSKGINATGGFLLGCGTNGAYFRTNGTSENLIYSGSISSSAFTNIRFARVGSTKHIIVAGTSVANQSTSANINDTSSVIIGANQGIVAANRYNGLIDDVRMVVGTSPTSYTPSSSAFQGGVVGGTENALIYDMLVPV